MIWDVVMRCSCPDWARPCKHMAAVLLLLGEEVARRPATLLALRGVDVEDLVPPDAPEGPSTPESSGWPANSGWRASAPATPKRASTLAHSPALRPGGWRLGVRPSRVATRERGVFRGLPAPRKNLNKSSNGPLLLPKSYGVILAFLSRERPTHGTRTKTERKERQNEKRQILHADEMRQMRGFACGRTHDVDVQRGYDLHGLRGQGTRTA